MDLVARVAARSDLLFTYVLRLEVEIPKDPIVQVADAIKASTSLQALSQLSDAEIEELRVLISHDIPGEGSVSRELQSYIDSVTDKSKLGIIRSLIETGLLIGSVLPYGNGTKYFCSCVNPRGYWAVERHDLLAEQERLQQELAEKRYQRDRAEDRKIALISAAIGAIATLVTTLATLLATKI